MTDAFAKGAVRSSLANVRGFCSLGGLENGKLLDPAILVLATAATWTMAPQAIGRPPLAQTQMSEGVDNGGGGADDSAFALPAVLSLARAMTSWWRRGGRCCLGIAGRPLLARATAVAAAVRTMVPRHRWLFSCSLVQWQCWRHGQWCLGIAGRSLARSCNGSSGGMDNGALA
jgi:hypothetical protein